MAVATGHIDPRVGNFLLIGLVGGLGAIAILSVALWLKHHNVPLLTPAADAGLDIVREAAA